MTGQLQHGKLAYSIDVARRDFSGWGKSGVRDVLRVMLAQVFKRQDPL